MCIDGLKQEQLLVGSTYTDFASGIGLAFGASEIGAAEIAADAVTLTKIAANAVDGDTATLTSGSLWVTFRSAFAAPPVVIPIIGFDTRTALGATGTRWVSAGSIAAGSFLLLGSSMVGAGTAGAVSWIAIGSR